jgi:hypothetical protein
VAHAVAPLSSVMNSRRLIASSEAQIDAYYGDQLRPSDQEIEAREMGSRDQVALRKS